MNRKNTKVGIIGLGYVGLPLAIEFSRSFNVLGFDTNENKVQSLLNGVDPSGEVPPTILKTSKDINFSSDETLINHMDFIVIAVPTPVDHSNQPKLEILLEATRIVADNIKKGATIIFESTVYPGTTEELCIPYIEKVSGLVWKKDFFIGYSPERVSPGDSSKSLRNVVKIVSADSEDTLIKIESLYEKIIDAGLYSAKSIKIAEAAKVVENTQRDVNIALMNELSMIFNRLDINTQDVLDAASTKWNFHNYSPGLVGGHCIGVDPYYLTYKAQDVGIYPKLILTSREINNNMVDYISEKILSSGAENILVLGCTFKENCSDLRNSKPIEVIQRLMDEDKNVTVHDPFLPEKTETNQSMNLNLKDWSNISKTFDYIFYAVKHDFYAALDKHELFSKLKENGTILDVKSVLKSEDVGRKDINLIHL